MTGSMYIDSRLSLNEVRATTFQPARLGHRGFDQEQVRTFHAKAEHELSLLLEEKASLAEEIGRLRGRIAGGAPDGPPDAVGPNDVGPDEAHVHAVRILAKAQQTADRYVADAQDYSRELAHDARRRRDEIVEEARANAAMVLEQAHGDARKAAAAIPASESAETMSTDELHQLQAELTYLRTFSDVCRTHLRSYLEALVQNVDEWERVEKKSLESVRPRLPHVQLLSSEEPHMSTQTSIYAAIGGEPALVAVVDDFYQRVTSDPELAGFFAGINMNRLKGRQVEFFAAALGGPHTYTGAPMRDVHRGRGIAQEHFDAVVGHLGSALGTAGVPAETVTAIVGLVAPLAGDIVGAGR